MNFYKLESETFSTAGLSRLMRDSHLASRKQENGSKMRRKFSSIYKINFHEISAENAATSCDRD